MTTTKTTTKTTTEMATAQAAAAVVAELEAKHHDAQQESTRAQAYAAALPGRLAAGDQAVTTDDLVQAGPLAAVAQAKATAVGQELAAAREVLERAKVTDIVAQLRAEEPFLSADRVDKELDRISAYVLRELAKLGHRIDAHNQGFYAVAGALPKGTHAFPAGPDGDQLTVHHDSNGKTLELAGARWWAMPTDGWGRDVLQRVEMFEALERDAARVPVPLFLTGEE
jgi:hypothetical protein